MVRKGRLFGIAFNDRRAGLLDQRRRNRLPEALGIDQALEPMFAHVAQRQSGRKLVAQKFSRYGRHQDLPAMCDRRTPPPV